MILKNLFRRKTRTLLTVLGVSIGVAAIVALGAMSESLQRGYGALGSGSGADLLVAQAESVDIAFSAIDEEIGAALAGMSGVREVDRMVYTFSSTAGVPYFIVFGYQPDGFAIEHFRIVAGEGLPERPVRRGGRPLILGQAMADDLDKEVGDTLRLYDITFRIVGIYETGEPFEDGAAVVSLEDAQALSGHPRQVNAFLLKLRTTDDVERVQQRIEQRFEDLTVTRSSNFAQEQEAMLYIAAFTWSISLIAVVIGGVVVMNTMLMSVFERTNEIGTLRALGWRRRQILAMVMGESILLNGLGGVTGVGIGIAVVELLEGVPAMNGLLATIIPPALIAQGIGVALVLGLLGGAYPAWRASRLAPAEAMRYEGSSGGSAAQRLKVGGTALRNLMRQPTRTLLTVTGIGLAMMAMVSIGAMTEGMIKELADVFGGSGIHLIGMQADASIDLSTIDVRTVRRIQDVPGVEAAEGFLTGYTAVGDLPFFVVFGYQPHGFAIQDFQVVEGAPLTANRQLLLGRVAAENLDKEVGQTLRIFDTSFRIVGIYETGIPFEEGGGVVSLRDAQALFGQPHKISFLGIRLEDPALAEAVRQEIERRFPEVSVSLVSEFAEDNAEMQLMRSSSWGIALLALLVGGAGMMNTMVMSVFERTREIGVLRSLGWSKGRVLGMILRESVGLSLLGGAAGIVAGIVAIFLLNRNPIMAGFVESRFSLSLFLQTAATALVLGAIGGMYPAWRASRLRPVEALRYE
ncbi:MAG: ABC transporter permease [Anaerolineae bacterium]|nr:ABC transporter permease [Anaerolineae bacterium]